MKLFLAKGFYLNFAEKVTSILNRKQMVRKLYNSLKDLFVEYL